MEGWSCREHLSFTSMASAYLSVSHGRTKALLPPERVSRTVEGDIGVAICRLPLSALTCRRSDTLRPHDR